VPLVNALFSVTSANVTTVSINHILPDTRFFGLHFCRRLVGLASTVLTQLDLKWDTFSVVTQNNGHYAVQVTQGRRYQSKAGVRLPNEYY